MQTRLSNALSPFFPRSPPTHRCWLTGRTCCTCWATSTTSSCECCAVGALRPLLACMLAYMHACMHARMGVAWAQMRALSIHARRADARMLWKRIPHSVKEVRDLRGAMLGDVLACLPPAAVQGHLWCCWTCRWPTPTHARTHGQHTCTNLQGNPELSAVWRLLQHLWQRQYIGVWQELQAHPWSPQAQPLVDALSAKTRQELIELIGMSYVNVKPSKVASLCGMPLPDALAGGLRGARCAARTCSRREGLPFWGLVLGLPLRGTSCLVPACMLT